MSDPEIEEVERECYKMLAYIDRQYAEARKPYIEQLVKLRALQPPLPIFISKEVDQ